MAGQETRSRFDVEQASGRQCLLSAGISIRIEKNSHRGP
jgi:hypothetical protein